MSRRRWGLRALACGLACVGSQAWPLTVTYTAADLADVALGADRWRYDYTLSGDLGEFEGVSLLFAYGAFSALQVTTPPNPSALGHFTEQPNAALMADGLFTVSAVRPIVGENLGFAVAFDWLGSGPPGAQPYEQFDANFTVTARGVTTPVPEPASTTLLLMSLGALALLMRRRPETRN